jgi:hypothetical protein
VVCHGVADGVWVVKGRRSVDFLQTTFVMFVYCRREGCEYEAFLCRIDV